MSRIFEPRYIPPSLMSKVAQAGKQVQAYIITHPGSGERYGIFNRLMTMLTSWQDSKVPYDVFDPKTISPVSESWEVFRFYEATQAFFEWLSLQPDDLTVKDVTDAFDAIGTRGGNIFPQCNATPSARRAFSQIPPLNGESWAIYLEETNRRMTAVAAGQRASTWMDIPPTVFFDPSTKRWDVRPT